MRLDIVCSRGVFENAGMCKGLLQESTDTQSMRQGEAPSDM